VQDRLSTLPKKTASYHPEIDAIYEKVICLVQFGVDGYPSAPQPTDLFD